MGAKAILFNGMSKIISGDILKNEIFDIDFNGHMKVQFKQLSDGEIIPINAMNGWGVNCFNEVKNKKAKIQFNI